MNRKNQPKRKSITFEDDDFIFSEEPVSKREQRILGIKSEYMVFYIAIAIVGVILAFVLSLSSMNFFGAGGSASTGSSNNQTLGTPPIDTPTDGDILLGSPESTQTFLGIITAIDSANQVFAIQNVNTRQSSAYMVQTGTDLRGTFNQALIFSEFSVGDFVDVTHIEETINLTRLALSTDASVWDGRFTGLEINHQNNTLLVDGQVFAFNTDTMVFNEGAPYSLDQLHPLSIVLMRGVGNTVWYIESIQGFGTLRVIGSENIMGGFLEIGREGTIPLGEDVSPLDQELDVTSGVHRLVIHGDNIATETRDIIIQNGELYYLDLSDIEITHGHLHVHINQASAILTLNGMPLGLDEPVRLPFGQYRIIAQAPGYVAFDDLVDFEYHGQSLTIVLIPEPLTGAGNGSNESIVTGRVEIRTEPAGAYVFIDNVLVGISPVITHVELGQRHVVVQMDDFHATHMAIMVSNHNVPWVFELQPTPANAQPGLPNQLPPTSPPDADGSGIPIVQPPLTLPPAVLPPANTPVMPDQPTNLVPEGVITPEGESAVPVMPDDLTNVPMMPNNP